MRVVTFGLDEEQPRARYDALFEGCPHAFIQQSTLWAEVISELGPDEPVFMLAERDGEPVGALPCYLYRGSAGSILTSVPQAGPLGGVLVRSGESPEPVYAALLAEAARLAAAHECIALTLITSPFADDLRLYERYLQPDLLFENFTQVIDLGRVIRNGDWILPNNSERNPGRTIRKARAAELASRLSEDMGEFDRWYAIHQRRHMELGLTPLRRDLLERIQTVLRPRGRAFLQLVTAGEDIAAGCLYVHHRDICDAFIMSMHSEHGAKAPNYLLQEQALFTMWRRGIRYMNWQSSPRRGDGVYKFKQQWGSEERLYYFVTKLFGSRERILALGVDGIRLGYPGHYLVPFGVFESGFTQTRFRKP